jgi:hypothetical protein
MKAFALSFGLLILGAASATAQTAAPVAVNAAPSPQKEPSLEADLPKIGSTADVEHSRLATRPPTPLVSK